MTQRCGSTQRPATEPLRQYVAPEIDTGASHSRQERRYGVKHGASIDMSSHALPFDMALRFW